MRKQILYVVGELTNNKNHKEWQIVGVFNKESVALDNCTTDMHFIGEMELGKAYVGKNEKWTNAYYPMLEKKPKTVTTKK